MKLSESVREIFLGDGITTELAEDAAAALDEAATAPMPDMGETSLGQILDRVSSKSFGVLLMILSLPSALPVPAPGYSVPFGIALIFLASQIIMRRETPLLPEKVLQRKIKTKKNTKVVGFMVKFLQFFEIFVRPRLTFVFRAPFFYRLLGCVILACACSMCIPIPLTNTGPALGVFLIGLGMVEEDGLASAGGVFVSFAGIALTLTVLYFLFYVGVESTEAVKEIIKGWLGMS